MGAPKNALFVCFGCLPNVGTLTGLEVVRQVGPGTASIFCLGRLATEVQTVLDKSSPWMVAR